MAKGLDSYVMLAVMIGLTVYGQLIMKWQVSLVGPAPADASGKIAYVIHLLLKPWVMSCFAAAFLAAASWIVILNKLPLSWAYPFTSLTFPLVVFGSALFFREPVTLVKVAGVSLIMIGVALQAQG
jgi:multidrug transporter EmrE-like cation transporter